MSAETEDPKHDHLRLAGIVPESAAGINPYGSPCGSEAAGNVPDAADIDDSGELAITDAVYLLNHLFLGGRAPPAPYPDPGRDPTPDSVACP